MEEKVEQLQNELFSMRKPVSNVLETENAHLKFLLTEKDGEIRGLKHMIENYKLEIEKYTNALDNKQNTIDIENNEVVKYLKEANKKLELQNSNLMKEMQDLRNKVFEFQNANIISEQNLLERSQRINYLEETNDKLEKEIGNLNARLAAKEPPKVERIYESSKEVKYESDPYIIQKNNELSKELETALSEEAKAKKQIEELRLLLENSNNIQTRAEKDDKYQSLLNFILGTKSFTNHKNDALVFHLLKMNADNKRLLKMQKEQENMVLVNQKLEIIDGTLALYYDFVSTFLKFVYDIFKTSTDLSFKKKLNSFIVFKEKLIEIKSKANYFGIIATFFFRLKNLVYEDLPKLKVIKYDTNDQPIESELDLDVEDFSKNIDPTSKVKKPTLVSKKTTDEFHVNVRPVDFPKTANKQQMDEWIKNTLVITIKKYKQDKEGWDKYLLYIFRLLTIKYRVDFPMVKNNKIEVDKDLMIILETKICAATLNLFTYRHPANK